MPDVYRDIWHERWFYLPRWSNEAYYESDLGSKDEEENRQKTREHVGKLISEEDKRILSLVRQLFFVVDAAFGGLMFGHDTHESTCRARKRLTHPDCFPRYFLYRLPVGELSDMEIEKLIQSWNHSSKTEKENQVNADFSRFQQLDQFDAFLDKLLIFTTLIEPDTVRPVARSLAQRASRKGRREPRGRERYDEVKFRILGLIDNCADPTEIRPLLEETIKESVSIPFVVSLVLSCHKERGGEYFRLFDSIDIGSLRDICSQRLYAELVEADVDVFESCGEDDANFVLYQWGINWLSGEPKHRSVVQEYVMKLVDAQPEYLGRLLSSFVSSIHSDEPGFRLDEFHKVYDSKVIAEKLEQVRRPGPKFSKG
ncbi:MAG: hypothetical protein L0338_38110 [Acidobacteria bacterium]|nr:hypothetical protein [Acidobacteriota bacterium]